MPALRLPDQTTTLDAEVFSSAWKKLYTPIEAAFGAKVYGFGNGLSLVSGHQTVHLDLWAALALYKHLTGEEYSL